MAEFCKQCAEELGLPPDFVGLSTAEDTKNQMYCIVLCESCGVIQVDHEGRCVSPDCDIHGEQPTRRT